MSKDLLAELFNNSEISEEIRWFCMNFPEYRQSKELADIWFEKLLQLLGYEKYCEFEQAVIGYYGRQAHAYYLFGLGLRRELREALFSDAC